VGCGDDVFVVDQGGPAVEAAEVGKARHPGVFIDGRLLSTHNSTSLVLFAARCNLNLASDQKSSKKVTQRRRTFPLIGGFCMRVTHWHGFHRATYKYNVLLHD
jgi:hypothetical protein